jgi:hypothetical protein
MTILKVEEVKMGHISNREKKERERILAPIREALANYVKSEGCGCCSDFSKHEKALDRLGELLGMDRYDDDSGVDIYKYATLGIERRAYNG